VLNRVRIKKKKKKSCFESEKINDLSMYFFEKSLLRMKLMSRTQDFNQIELRLNWII